MCGCPEIPSPNGEVINLLGTKNTFVIGVQVDVWRGGFEPYGTSVRISERTALRSISYPGPRNDEDVLPETEADEVVWIAETSPRGIGLVRRRFSFPLRVPYAEDPRRFCLLDHQLGRGVFRNPWIAFRQGCLQVAVFRLANHRRSHSLEPAALAPKYLSASRRGWRPHQPAFLAARWFPRQMGCGRSTAKQVGAASPPPERWISCSSAPTTAATRRCADLVADGGLTQL